MYPAWDARGRCGDERTGGIHMTSMSANTAAAVPPSGPQDEREREQWLIAEAHRGSGWALAALETTYQPMVNGYLLCLTGNPEAARALTRDTQARMELHFTGSSGAPSLAAWLLLTATDSGMSYLRHARALQLAGVGGEPRLPSVPSRGGPTAWLRSALERFRPAQGQDRQDRREEPRRGDRVGGTAQHFERMGEPTRRLRDGGRVGRHDVGRDASWDAVRSADLGRIPPAPDPRDTLRRRVLRATLADLAPAVARCLALHLVAGLSHGEVAYVAGLNSQAARAAIVEGLELFAVRYDEALELVGLSPSLFADHAAGHALTQPSLPLARSPLPETLHLREAAVPTLQLGHRTGARMDARASSPTTPRHAVRTLPMPRAPRPAAGYATSTTRSRADATPTRSLRAVASSSGSGSTRPERVPVLSGAGATPRIPVIPVRSPANHPRI